MRSQDAVRLINEELTFMPGWKITATRPYADAMITLTIKPPFPDSDVRYFPDYRQPLDSDGAQVSFSVWTMDRMELMWTIYRYIMAAFDHEAREFLSLGRIDPWKPFHPHTMDGEYYTEHFRQTLPVGV